MARRVVITGIGPVTSIGIGAREFFQQALALKTCIQTLPADYEKKYKFKSRFYVPFPNFQLPEYGLDSSYERMMEKTSKISLVAAKLALQDADLLAVENARIILGIGIGALSTSFQSHIAHTQEHASTRYNRMIIPIQMPNAASAWVSIVFGIKGPNYTLNAACASGTMALGEAYLKLAHGRDEVALAGGVECLEDKTGSIMRGFDTLSALTKSADGHPYPFSKNRSGFLFSDGAGCILVLETLGHAQKRGARIYAEIIGYETNSDAHHIVQIDPTGSQIVPLLRKLTAP